MIVRNYALTRDWFEASMFEAKAQAKSLRGQGRPSGLRGQGQDYSRPRPVVLEANEKRYVQGTSILFPLDVNIFS